MKNNSRTTELGETFIGECIKTNNKKDLLVFLLDTLPTVQLRYNSLKECVEIYIPQIPLPEDSDDSDESES